MVTRFGMSDTFGMMALETRQRPVSRRRLEPRVLRPDGGAHRRGSRSRSSPTAIEQAYQILSDNKEKLHETAKVLLEKETITGMEFMAILAPNQLPSAETEKAEEKPEEKPDDSADDVEVK